jgi:serine/threonine-protein kinase
MLTGKTPFHDKTPHELLTAKLTQPAPPITGSRTDIPPNLSRLIMQCLEQEPAKRPQTAAEVVDALEDPSILSGAQPIPVVRRPNRFYIAGGVGAALVAALVFVVLGRRGSASEAPRSVAVVPLTNVGGDSSTVYLADGLTDEITLALARLPGLRVAARSATASYRGTGTPARDIGRALGVATVLEGSIQVADGRLRLMAQLTDARDGLSLWSQRFEGSMRDVFALQDSLASAVAEALRSRFGGAPVTAARGEAGTTDVAAYDLFLRGRFLFRRRGAAELREAIRVLDSAVTRDPGFARAYATLADAWAVLPLYGGADPDTAREQALGFVEQALALDSTLADALASRGNLYMGMWRWEEAEADLRRATELDSSSINAWQWYGEWLLYNGRNAEAERALAKAVALDPASPALIAIHGVMLTASGRTNEGVAATQRAMSIDSSSVVARMMHGLVLACVGRNADAMASFEATRSVTGDAPPVVSMLGYTWARAGQRPKAEALRDSLLRSATAPGVTGILAHTMLGLGDTAQALTWLEWSAGAHDAIFVTVPFACTIWDPIRSSSRFTSVMRRVGLGQ